MVCGGDGIVHTALQVVVGTAVPLGIIPAGSGNDFARALGLPLGDIVSAAALVLAGHSIAVDLALQTVIVPDYHCDSGGSSHIQV